MKKAEEIYGRMKDMFVHPQAVPPPVQRRTLVSSRKVTPTMTDYVSKVRNCHCNSAVAWGVWDEVQSAQTGKGLEFDFSLQYVNFCLAYPLYRMT